MMETVKKCTMKLPRASLFHYFRRIRSISASPNHSLLACITLSLIHIHPYAHQQRHRLPVEPRLPAKSLFQYIFMRSTVAHIICIGYGPRMASRSRLQPISGRPARWHIRAKYEIAEHRSLLTSGVSDNACVVASLIPVCVSLKYFIWNCYGPGRFMKQMFCYVLWSKTLGAFPFIEPLVPNLLMI